MEILKNFGLNPYLLVAQIVNFIIVLFVLKKLLYKPILSMIKKRDDDIKNGIKQAEEGRKLLEDASKKEKEILKQAQDSAEKVLSDAKVTSQDMLKDSEEKTKAISERMLEETQELLDRQRKGIEVQISKKVAKIAVDILERSISDLIDSPQQKIIVKRAQNRLQRTRL